jgi:proteasome lid subunit RPN8/RPN11
MLEAGVVLCGATALYWHIPPGRSFVSLPEDYDLWQIFWKNRDKVTAFAHTHPGSGRPEPSSEDLSTFKAIEDGLGKRLNWFILSSDTEIICFKVGDIYESFLLESKYNTPTENEWMSKLRELSNYK